MTRMARYGAWATWPQSCVINGGLHVMTMMIIDDDDDDDDDDDVRYNQKKVMSTLCIDPA